MYFHQILLLLLHRTYFDYQYTARVKFACAKLSSCLQQYFYIFIISIVKSLSTNPQKKRHTIFCWEHIRATLAPLKLGIVRMTAQLTAQYTCGIKASLQYGRSAATKKSTHIIHHTIYTYIPAISSNINYVYKKLSKYVQG